LWIVDVASEARAIAIATGALAAPGIGCSKMSIPIELRQVMDHAHSAPDFTADAENDTLALLFPCSHRSVAADQS